MHAGAHARPRVVVPRRPYGTGATGQLGRRAGEEASRVFCYLHIHRTSTPQHLHPSCALHAHCMHVAHCPRRAKVSHSAPHLHTTHLTAAPAESKGAAVQAQAPPAEAAAVEGEMALIMPEGLPKVRVRVRG